MDTVDDYLARFTPDQRKLLQLVRDAIHRGVTGGDGQAEEKIRYGMPAVMLGGRYAIHFAGWKKHIGLYPVPRLPDELEARIAPHRREKDSVIFVWQDPVPFELIEQVAAAITTMRTE